MKAAILIFLIFICTAATASAITTNAVVTVTNTPPEIKVATTSGSVTVTVKDANGLDDIRYVKARVLPGEYQEMSLISSTDIVGMYTIPVDADGAYTVQVAASDGVTESTAETEYSPRRNMITGAAVSDETSGQPLSGFIDIVKRIIAWITA